MITTITGYPLSLAFRTRLESQLGEVPTYLYLPELRRLPLSAQLRALSRVGALCVIALEDASSYPLRPILEALAAASPAKRIEIIHPDLRRERVTRRRAAAQLAALAAASLGGQVVLRRHRSELRELLRAPRLHARLGDSDRIVFANGNLWFGVKAGGSVGHIAGVLQGFARSGLHTEYLAVAPPETDHAAVRFTPLDLPGAFGLPVELNHSRFHDVVQRHIDRLLETPTRFLYQRMSIANYAGVVAARGAGLPLVLEYNGSEVWAARHWGTPLRYEDVAKAAEDACLKHAALVVTISDVLREELRDRGVAEDRIIWYPNCVDPQVYDPERFDTEARSELRASLGIPTDAVLVTFVGTFGAWHGAEILARAIARFVDRNELRPSDATAHFLFVGDGVRMPAVRRVLDADSYRRNVSFAGLVPQSDAPSYLAASDVLVSPHVANTDGSRFFGSPTKLFEYMAMGKAIVASDLDQIGDVLQPALRTAALPHGSPCSAREVAVLTSPGDENELACGIRFLVGNASWRTVLGENARSRALSRYTWDHHVGAILAGIEMLS